MRGGWSVIALDGAGGYVVDGCGVACGGEASWAVVHSAIGAGMGLL